MAKDLHKNPFDEGTEVKLALLGNYINEWLPVFLNKNASSYTNEVNIFDFFSGPGKDIKGKKGSPLIIIDKIERWKSEIKKGNIKVNLYFNDSNKKKICELKENIRKLKLDENIYNVSFSKEDFQCIFKKCIKVMDVPKSCNFLFIDQNGVSHARREIMESIAALTFTDFLIFTSSSFLHRFKELKDKIGFEYDENASYFHIHRNFVNHLRGYFPESYNLLPFSIKKGANIYGVTFGSSHSLGAEKFLRECWKINPETGEANFNIDNDHIDHDYNGGLFDDVPGFKEVPKKLEVFENEINKKLKNKEFYSNIDIYDFTLKFSCLPDHARKIINDSMKHNIIPKQKLNISYDCCKKRGIKQIINYKV